MSVESRRALLCVDLDGTLVATDTLDECLLCLVRHRPLQLFLLPFWLLGGKAHFKERVAAAAAGSLGQMPFRNGVLQYIAQRGDDVDEVVLATAANWRVAQHVAGQCDFVTHVLASDAGTNLSGAAKLAAIRGYADGRPFDYIGDHAVDLPIWDVARQAIVVSDSNRLQERINGASRVTQILPGAGATARDWLQQLRVHQWSKNLLLLLPLILAHKVTSPPAVAACLVAMIAFSCCASAVYLVNDLIDLPYDRAHPTKSKRPIARGVISIRQAVFAAGGMAGVATLLSIAFLPWTFLVMLAGYFALSLTYSIWLKRVVVLDVLLLAGFYVYRVLIGAVAINVPVSFWLLAFSMFFFLALGIIKRYADLVQAANLGQERLSGRSYTTADLDFFRSLGMSSSAVAVLVLALYLESSEVTKLYPRPEFLWLVCPLALYWIIRVWLIASRGQMPDDPILFALRDRVSYVVAGLTAILLVLATLWGRGV